MTISFDNPTALWLLLLIPAAIVVAWLGIVYLPRRVRNAAVVIRVVVLAALILAIAQPVLHQPSNQLSVIFAVDRSASVALNGAGSADSWLAKAVTQKGPNDQFGVVEFGANAIVRQPLGVDAKNPPSLKVDPGATNLSGALHLATSLFPPNGAHRIIVLSDGQENVANATTEARQDSTRHVQIDVVPVSAPPGLREVLIQSLVSPPYVRRGQHFDVSTIVQSTVKEDATLQFLEDGTQVSSGKVSLKPGVNRFSINLTAKTDGFHTFEAQITAPQDTYKQNNRDYSYTVVQPPATVAVIASNPRDASAVEATLKASGVTVDQMAPAAIPPNVSAMKKYDGAIIVNTPASAFTQDQMTTIASFVHDLGHGLVVIGGSQSYGLGKYDGTPLGDALPVQGSAPGNLQDGKVALALVIDKSGSMDETEGGVRKMAMADKAAQLAIGLLAPTDQIAVEAFDTDPSWVVPLQSVGNQANRQRVENAVGQISASGGTDIYAALKQAYDAIHQSNATYKHIILLSDGNSLVESNYNPLLQNIEKEHITLSTIAIGSDADLKLMQMLAKRGNGRYYYTDQASAIPEITTRETRIVSGSSKVDAVFQPQIASPSPMLDSISGRSLPTLSGYDVTTARTGAEVTLQSDRQDPILVDWNYGLGRVVAWTSDLTSQWAKPWLSWPTVGQFWSQVINWSLPAPSDPNWQTSYTVSGTTVDFKVDVVNDQGVFQDLLDMRASVPGQDGKATQVLLNQTRPGRYEAKFSIPTPGAYPVNVVEYQSGRVVKQELTGVVMPYPAEYQRFGVNQQNLASIAAVTGGSVLHDPSESFSHVGIPFEGRDRVPLWPWLLALAAILFPIDVAIRRLRLDPLTTLGRGWTSLGNGVGNAGDWVGGKGESLRRRLRHSRPAANPLSRT